MKSYAKIVLSFLIVLIAGCNNGSARLENKSSVSMDSASGGVADNAVNVSLTPIIALKFTSTMNPSTITDKTIFLTTLSSIKNSMRNLQANDLIPISSITANADNTIFYFSPISPLVQNTKYYVIVTDGVKTIVGSPVTGRFSFTTGDFIAPTVSIINPSNNATGVSDSPTLQIQFSEAVQSINTNTITLHEGSASGSTVALSSITAGANNSYTFSPATTLKQQTTYYLVLSNGITDMAGNALPNTSFSFTTGDFTAPTVGIINPSNNATGVSANPTIQIQFSEAVQSINTNTITLHEGSASGSTVALSSITAGANNSYTFSPATTLKQQTTYYLVLSNGITDMAGNALTNTSFSFTTEVRNTWVNVGSAGFSAGAAYYQSLAIDSNGTPYVAYQDEANSNKTTVMKFNGSNWVNIGSAGFSAGVTAYQSLAIDSNGMPYVAYQDKANSNKTTVMKFNGSSWVSVGSAGFLAGAASYQSLAIASNGTPYVAYQDEANSNKTTVMKFNGSNWVNIGNSGFSAGTAYFQSLAIDSNGTPYVAYQDEANSSKTTVMKFNGSSWVNVGNSGFSFGVAAYQSLAIDSNGTPYVAYSDWENSSKTTVMKFNGSSWESVGNPGFSLGHAFYQSLAIASNGTLYVAYKDEVKTTVMKFNGSSWESIGSPNFSTGVTAYQSLAIDSNGTPYVAYQDWSKSYKTTVMKFIN
jgi:hypothetical protein